MSYRHEHEIPVISHDVIEAGIRRASRERSLAFYAALGLIRDAFRGVFTGRNRKSGEVDTGHLAIGRACREVM